MDWFKGEGGKYQWFDEPKGDFSDVETKQTWTHIGANDEDLLKDIGLPVERIHKKDFEIHQSYSDHGDNWAANNSEITSLNASIKFRPNVGFSDDYKNINNKQGKFYDGINVNITFDHQNNLGETNPSVNFIFDNIVFKDYKMNDPFNKVASYSSNQSKSFELNMIILKPRNLNKIEIEGSFWINNGWMGRTPKALPFTLGTYPNSYSIIFNLK
jgi:hypothetical protein